MTKQQLINWAKEQVEAAERMRAKCRRTSYRQIGSSDDLSEVSYFDGVISTYHLLIHKLMEQ